MSSNEQNDDAVSSYTFTETGTFVELEESSVVSIYPNPSNGEIIINLDGISGRFIMEIYASNGSTVIKDIIEFKGEAVNKVLDDYTPGLYHLHLYNSSYSYKKELILE